MEPRFLTGDGPPRCFVHDDRDDPHRGAHPPRPARCCRAGSDLSRRAGWSGRWRLRTASEGVERVDRPAPGADRSVRRGGRRHRCHPLCPPGRARRGGPKRRPQLSRLVGVRRRAGDRPLPDEGGAGRPGQPDGAGPGGGPAGRARPGDPGLRAGRAGGHRDPHRAGRSHPGRRDRLADAQVRPDHRPAALGGPGHRRRGAGQGQRHREQRPVLGHPRGRGELRHRHRVRVPAQPRRPRGPRRAGHLADGAVSGGAALLPRLDHRRAGRAHHGRRAPQGAAPARAALASCTADPSSRSICCYAGPVEDGERVVRPLKAFGSPLLDLAPEPGSSTTRRCSTPRSRRAGGTTSGPATSRP